jgi:hypothetical protein
MASAFQKAGLFSAQSIAPFRGGPGAALDLTGGPGIAWGAWTQKSG